MSTFCFVVVDVVVVAKILSFKSGGGLIIAFYALLTAKNSVFLVSTFCFVVVAKIISFKSGAG